MKDDMLKEKFEDIESKMRCEWCEMEYPDGGWDCYYYLNLFGKIPHIICSDCYDHLHKVIFQKDIENLTKHNSQKTQSATKKYHEYEIAKLKRYINFHKDKLKGIAD